MVCRCYALGQSGSMTRGLGNIPHGSGLEVDWSARENGGSDRLSRLAPIHYSLGNRREVPVRSVNQCAVDVIARTTHEVR